MIVLSLTYKWYQCPLWHQWIISETENVVAQTFWIEEQNIKRFQFPWWSPKGQWDDIVRKHWYSEFCIMTQCTQEEYVVQAAQRGWCTERHSSRKEVRPLEQTRAHSVQWIKVSKYITTFFHLYTVSRKYGLTGRNRRLMHIIKYAASVMALSRCRILLL